MLTIQREFASLQISLGNLEISYTYEGKFVNFIRYYHKNRSNSNAGIHTRIWISTKYLNVKVCSSLAISGECYVVGSRRLMPPDALQPKAYCTNRGL